MSKVNGGGGGGGARGRKEVADTHRGRMVECVQFCTGKSSKITIQISSITYFFFYPYLPPCSLCRRM